MTTQRNATILRNLGWRLRTPAEATLAVENFQAGWNLGHALAVDGHDGPLTAAALTISDSRRREGRPTASAHFSFAEVQCRCAGRFQTCPRIWQRRAAFVMMENYRARSGAPLNVVSGCRCPRHNKEVGGSPTSRHKEGLACDVPPRHTLATVKRWKVATHLGYGSVSRKVVHLDYGAGGTTTAPVVYPDGR